MDMNVDDAAFSGDSTHLKRCAFIGAVLWELPTGHKSTSNVGCGKNNH